MAKELAQIPENSIIRVEVPNCKIGITMLGNLRGKIHFMDLSM